MVLEHQYSKRRKYVRISAAVTAACAKTTGKAEERRTRVTTSDPTGQRRQNDLQATALSARVHNLLVVIITTMDECLPVEAARGHYEGKHPVHAGQQQQKLRIQRNNERGCNRIQTV